MRRRIALLPLLALGISAAPAASAQGGGNTVPRELLHALLFPFTIRGQPEPEIVVGRRPASFPASLLPPAATVVGGVPGRSGGRLLLTVPQPPAEAIAGWKTQLERAGWHASDDPSLRPSPAMPTLALCGPGREMLTAWATPRPQGGSEIQLSAVLENVPELPCSGVRRPLPRDVPFPPIHAPEGVEMMGSGGGGSADYHDAEGRMRSTRAPAELAADLVGQLRKAGWTAADPRGDAGGATAWAEMRDAGGRSWRALVAVLKVDEGQRFYVVRVSGASTEPRHGEVEWGPAARAQGPPVPGRLARALLVHPRGNGEVEEPVFTAGRLPPELASAPLPPGARVLGGASYADEATGVAFVPGDVNGVLAAYSEALQRAGWLPNSSDRLAFLGRPAPAFPTEFCTPEGRSVHVTAIPVRDGGGYLTLESNGAAGSCRREWVEAFREIPLPALPAPDGARQTSGGGGGGSQYDWEASGRLETALTPAALVEYYAGLLRQAGWTVRPSPGDETGATASAELRDAKGETWHGVISAVALSPTEREVVVRAVRPQPW
ncbi:MAG TPA: hypothetical protein VF092_24010 [Longimicrobium sp.]